VEAADALRMEANGLQTLRRDAEAIRLFETAKALYSDAKHPDGEAMCLWLSAVSHTRLGNTAVADDFRGRARSLNPTIAETMERDALAITLLGRRQRDKAAAYDASLQTFDLALAIYASLENCKGPEARCLLDIAWALLKLKRYDEAIAVSERGLEMFPDEREHQINRALGLGNLATICGLKGDDFRAIRCDEEAEQILLAEEVSDNRLASIRQNLGEHLCFAWTTERWKQPDAAKLGLERALGVLQSAATYYRGDPQYGDDLRACFKFMGRVQDALKRYEEALESYRTALALDPGDVPADILRGLASMLAACGNYKDALAEIERAHTLAVRANQATEAALCLLEQGTILDKCRRHLEAATAYAVAAIEYATLGDVNGEALSLKFQGEALLKAERFEEALQPLSESRVRYESLQKPEDVAWCLFQTANALQRLGRHDEAKSLFIEAQRHWSHVSRFGLAAMSLRSLAESYEALGDSNKALDALIEATSASKRSGEKDAEAHDIWRVGNGLEKRGEFAQARANYEQAIALFSTLSDDSYMQYDVMRDLASLLKRMDLERDIDTLLISARRSIDETGPPLTRARSEAALGMLERSLGDVDLAIRRFESALSVLLKLRDADGTARRSDLMVEVALTTNRLASTLRQRGRHQEVIACVGSTVALVGTHPDTFDLVLTMLGHQAGVAVTDLKQPMIAVESYRALLQDSVLGDGDRLALLRGLYWVQNQGYLYADALVTIQEIERIGAHVEPPLQHVHTIAQVAGAFFNLGQQDNALRHYDDALALLDGLPPKDRESTDALEERVDIYIDKAGLLLDDGHIGEARALADDALRIAHNLPNSTQALASYSWNWGFAEHRAGNEAEAIRWMEDAVNRYDAIAGGELNRAMSRRNLALFLMAANRPTEAQKRFDEAIALLQGLSVDKDDLWFIRFFQQQNNVLKQPKESAQQLRELIEEAWDRVVPSLDSLTFEEKQLFATYLTSDRDAYIRGFMLTLTLGGDGRPSEAPEAGLAITLLLKGLVADVSRHRSTEVNGANSDQLGNRNNLRELMREQSALGHSVADDRKRDQGGSTLALENRWHDVQREVDALRVREARASDHSPPRRITPNEVMTHLPLDSILIEYVRYHPYDFKSRKPLEGFRYGAFVAGADGRVMGFDLREADGPSGIDNAIAEFHRLLANGGRAPENLDALVKVGNELRRRIFSPILETVGPIKRIYISPDGPIAFIPFECLPAHEPARGDPRFLVEEFEIVYLNTGRDLCRFRADGPNSRKGGYPLLVGDPCFDLQCKPKEMAAPNQPKAAVRSEPGPGPEDLQRLLGGSGIPTFPVPETRDLITTIGKLAGPTSSVLTDNDAIEGNILSIRNSPWLLAFATHGCYLSELQSVNGPTLNPLERSLLVLAGAEEKCRRERVTRLLDPNLDAAERDALRQIGDGLLTGYEISSMNLCDTELVALVACETGLGEVEGEGDISGIRQSFFLAGAHSMIVTAWKVPVDGAIPQMEDFFHDWLSEDGQWTGNRYRAFHNSQRKALERARTDKRMRGHPYWWGGFMYIGDPSDAP